ncbi:hypothetical protein BDV59DRAFT_156156 [Aspergillus ambiguus]|uniref:uncharacterized protein n=1 Tax=Aspergillus ambiguus TaxID=176160 RepID=UPI003CCDEC7D
MARFRYSLSIFATVWLLYPQLSCAAKPHFPPNANHIFNTLHDSMRQWGSSLHHNGMSFFLATVPEGTQLYHGDHRQEPITGPEWLAFEAEHAMVFANPYPRGPPPPDHGSDEEHRGPPPRHEHELRDDGALGGWLHTYTAAKDLRLLYIDGMSAGKTSNGTMDSQDRILFRDAVSGHDERERAELLCRMAREDWKDRVDGVIRMEAGFEIILCDFTRDLNEIRVTQVKHKPQDKGGRRGPPKGPLDGANGWIKAVAARYNGIGGNRVIINYDDFVTAYAYGLDLFCSPDGDILDLPRLTQLATEDLEPIRADVDRLIMDHGPKEASTNWQAIADMVVERYARELRYLASGRLTSIAEIHDEIEGLLGPFIDYSDRNVTLEIDRCASHFLPAGTSSDSIAAAAVRSVARSICATLTETLDQTSYDTALTEIRSLMEYLSWTTWKECSGCADNEVCIVPMWPMGTVEDYKHPQCRDPAKPNGNGQRYWGNFGRPPKAASWKQRLSHSLQTILW